MNFKRGTLEFISLSRNVVKFECENFSIMKYYADLYVRKNRKKLKVR